MPTWKLVTSSPNINIAEAHDIIKKLSYKAFEADTKVLIMWLPVALGTISFKKQIS